jgi:hypothetical protein
MTERINQGYVPAADKTRIYIMKGMESGDGDSHLNQ